MHGSRRAAVSTAPAPTRSLGAPSTQVCRPRGIGGSIESTLCNGSRGVPVCDVVSLAVRTSWRAGDAICVSERCLRPPPVVTAGHAPPTTPSRAPTATTRSTWPPTATSPPATPPLTTPTHPPAPAPPATAPFLPSTVGRTDPWCTGTYLVSAVAASVVPGPAGQKRSCRGPCCSKSPADATVSNRHGVLPKRVSHFPDGWGTAPIGSASEGEKRWTMLASMP